MKDHSLVIYHQLQQIYVLLDDGDRRTLRAVGLTPTQYNLLLKLELPTEEGQTITELSQALLCTRGNITRLVRRLEQQGLVLCNGDDRDQRLVRVSLSPLGASRLAQAKIAHTTSVHRRLGALDHEVLATLRSLMQQVSALLSSDLESLPAQTPPFESEELEV
jgi:MarR family transcriptional regulator, 2-MHQ and catechol-resistance regulon repressor